MLNFQCPIIKRCPGWRHLLSEGQYTLRFTPPLKPLGTILLVTFEGGPFLCSHDAGRRQPLRRLYTQRNIFKILLNQT